MSEIHIAREFTESPGPRYRDQGDGSGEEFREEHLLPAFRNTPATDKVAVHLDGVKSTVTRRHFWKKHLVDWRGRWASMSLRGYWT